MTNLGPGDTGREDPPRTRPLPALDAGFVEIFVIDQTSQHPVAHPGPRIAVPLDHSSIAQSREEDEKEFSSFHQGPLLL